MSAQPCPEVVDVLRIPPAGVDEVVEDAAQRKLRQDSAQRLGIAQPDPGIEGHDQRADKMERRMGRTIAHFPHTMLDDLQQRGAQ